MSPLWPATAAACGLLMCARACPLPRCTHTESGSSPAGHHPLCDCSPLPGLPAARTPPPCTPGWPLFRLALAPGCYCRCPAPRGGSSRRGRGRRRGRGVQRGAWWRRRGGGGSLPHPLPLRGQAGTSPQLWRTERWVSWHITTAMADGEVGKLAHHHSCGGLRGG